MEQVIEIDAAIYGALLSQKRPRTIRTEEEYDAVAEEVEEISFKDAVSPEEREYLNLLHLLLAAYDEAHPPYGKTATHAEILAHVLEHRGMKQADLIPVVGSSAYVSQILSGKRGISRNMAKRLGEFFGLEASVFLN